MSLEPRFRHTCDDALEDNSFLYHNVEPLTLRATHEHRAPFEPHEHHAGLGQGPPSNLGVELKADTSTFEYGRHRACLSVKTSTDEPSHVPLHARTLRGAALSS